MAIALPAFLVGLGILLLWVVRLIALGIIVDALRSAVPIVGNAIADLFQKAERWVTDGLASWLAAHLEPLTHWFTQARLIVSSWQGVLAHFAGDLASTLEALVAQTLPAIVAARLAPVARAIGLLGHGLVGIGDDLIALGHRLTHELDGLRDWAIQNILERALRGIDRLRHDVMDVALPAIRGRVGAIERSLEDAVGGIGDRLGRLERGIGAIPLRDLLALLAAFPLLQALVSDVVMPAVEDVVRCRRKIRWLCTTDPDLWDDVFGDLIPFLGLAAIVAAVEEFTPIVEGMTNLIEEVLDG